MDGASLLLSIYLEERRGQASLFSRLKSAYVECAHRAGGSSSGAELLTNAKAAPLSSWKRFAASQLAICDLDRMIDLDVPWWNRKAALDVDAFLTARPQARVFEFGSGSSTIWLARRAARVVSAEPVAAWAEALAPRLSDFGAAELFVRSLTPGGGAFAGSIAETNSLYDLIVIDGRERAACLRKAVSHLAPGGLILFDDSCRSRYRSAIKWTGLKESRYFGPAFAKPYPDHTSILRR